MEKSYQRKHGKRPKKFQMQKDYRTKGKIWTVKKGEALNVEYIRFPSFCHMIFLPLFSVSHLSALNFSAISRSFSLVIEIPSFSG